MSTNARIGLQADADAEVRSIYVHWDGYPAGVGRTLLDHWSNTGRVLELIDLGDLSALGQILGTKHDFDTALFVRDEEGNTIDSPTKDWCLAYGRDRGEENVGAKTHPKDAWPSSSQEWEYLFVLSLGEWLGREIGWGERPNGPWTPLADLVQRDEARDRLEHLRQELRAERISWGELAELQSLAKFITPGDVELLEAAGVPEFPEDE